MRQRRLWTAEQDKVLKLLREEQKIKKWSTIAKMMQEDYSLPNRTGKQCRQRYFNHLDSQIRHQEWTEEEQRTLWQMHSQFGNRWTLMTSRIKGRSQNCIKNHFYSKLRKAVRRLNKLIIQRFKAQFKQIKTSLLYKILQSAEDKFRPGKSANIETRDLATSIKNRLFLYETEHLERSKQLQIAKSLIRDTNALQERFKNEEKNMKNTSGFLDPRSARFMDQSFQSEDNLSLYSSTSYNSSFQHSEEDDDEDMPSQRRNIKLLNKLSLEEKKSSSQMDEEQEEMPLHSSWTNKSRFAPLRSTQNSKQESNFLGGNLAQSLNLGLSRSQKTFSFQLNNDDKVSDIGLTHNSRGQNQRCISDIAKNQDSQNQWDELDNNFIYPKSAADDDICNDDFFGDPTFQQFQIVVNSPKVPSDDGKEILGEGGMDLEQEF